MAQIGIFTKGSDGSFSGEIVTLLLQANNVRLVAEDNRQGDASPSHRVMVGRADIGAGWTKTSAEGRTYIGLKLDDPSFNAPIYANLSETGDGKTWSLIWSRQNRRD